MTKLTRVTGKVFAGSADLVNLGVFGSAKAGSPTNPTGTGTEAQIQAPAAYNAGWTAAIVTSRNFPPIEEVNGVLRTISYQNCYLLQEGIPTFDINTEYSDTSVVKSVGNGGELILYVSLQDGNIGHQPGAVGSEEYWTRAVFVGSSAIGVPQITLNFNLVNAPENCVWLDGAVKKQASYQDLYNIYGNSYWDGETPVASDEFQLPDFRDRVLWGGETAGYIPAGLPNLTGSFPIDNRSWLDGTLFKTAGSNNSGADGSGGLQYKCVYDASDYNPIYGGSTTVQPPAIKFRAYTRYQ